MARESTRAARRRPRCRGPRIPGEPRSSDTVLASNGERRGVRPTWTNPLTSGLRLDARPSQNSEEPRLRPACNLVHPPRKKLLSCCKNARGTFPRFALGFTATGGWSLVRSRRFRHKLMLGLALVVGSVGLLLGGTLYGFRAYTNTVRTTERKLYEHQQVEILLVALTEPPRSSQTDVNTEFSDLNKMTNLSRDIAAAYRVELSRTVEQGLDP